MKNKINSFLDKYIYKILVIYIFIQPLLDVVTAVSLKYMNLNVTIGALIRLLFMAFCTIYLLFFNNTEYKKKSLICSIIIYLYIIIFGIITYFNKDISVLSYEIKNTLNTFYFPIVFLGLFNMFKQYKIKFNIKYLIYVFTIYLLFIIIPDITNTSFASYSHSKLGNIGWFLSANAIGSILCFLLPIVILYFIKIPKKYFYKVVLLLSVLYIFANMGTKTPILSIMIIALINIIYIIIQFIKKKDYKKIGICFVIVIVSLILSIIIIPKTSFYKNLEIHKEYLGMNNYTEIFTDYDMANNFIFSERLTFLTNTNNSYKKSDLTEKIFGIGYIEQYNTDSESTKTIEMDYFDIFYRHGIVGFIIYFVVFIYALIMTMKKVFKNNNIVKLEYLSIIFLILILSLFSGHILITPSVSIYVALIFTIILYEQYILGLEEK